MTRAKKLKKQIRNRARKTGESYTAARRQVLTARAKGTTPAQTANAPATTKGPVRTSGEAGVVKKTGHGYDHWFAVLDAFDTRQKGHTAAAEHLYSTHGVPAWHAQMITVAYERARGLRAVNQASTGRFQVSVSRVVPVSVKDVADAIGDPRQRAAWLASADPALRKAMKAAFVGPKAKSVKIKDAHNATFRFKWDGATVEIHIIGKPKGDGTSVVASNTNLPDSSKVEERRAQWRVALDALREHLG